MNIRYFSQVTNPGFVSTYEYVKAEHNSLNLVKKEMKQTVVHGILL
jgi:hypothetical protein